MDFVNYEWIMGLSGKISLKPIHCFRGAGSFKMIKGFDVLNYDEEAGIGAAAAQAWEGPVEKYLVKPSGWEIVALFFQFAYCR